MSGALVLLLAITVYHLIGHYGGRHFRQLHFSRFCRPPAISSTVIVVRGSDLLLTPGELHRILLRRFSYYGRLSDKARQIFLFRLQQFLRKKTFIIKDDEGFREMPVLVSAAAIQLTFGLPDFLLSFYRHIRIYPEEFFSDDLTRILAGNVSSNTITVAWTHFLQGYHHEKDGSNVGLHEMSHALYFQKVEVEQGYTKAFARRFQTLYDHCHHASDAEKAGKKDLYSAYADKSLQEFWAETVELFFEKPAGLQEHHPEVFDNTVRLLNQNPLLRDDPVINRRKARPVHHYTL